ncbi:hypothetical protein P43SY_001105 [Pythium insidiosum]|uniref:Transmembrane protein n=1 Tax=Pythium insidiosum TaxID=114742 RepID=A0AAD5M784_PYTIN|nr:hypothetical protein P43SY_001105 [Pythium insidiosum]
MSTCRRHPRDVSSPWRRLLRAAAVAGVGLVALSAPTASSSLVSSAANHFRGGHWHHSPSSGHHGPHIHTTQSSAHHVSRRLDNNAAVDKAVAKANEVGASVRKAVKQLRGGTDKFYRDLIKAVEIVLCDQKVKSGGAESPRVRFVAPTSENAYKDDQGNCIRVAVTAATDDTVKNEYSMGKCEVKPNCYWGEIASGETERRPTYAVVESAQPPNGAMTYAEAEETVKKWAQGLMVFVVPGIILAVLSLLTMIFFLICRCCCNRCGGRRPKEGGYSCMQKFLPVLFFLLFAVGIVVTAGVSLLYQKTLTGAVTDSFQATSDTLGKGSLWIADIRTPLESIRDSVIVAAGDVSTALAGTDFIEDGINGLTTRLEDFGSYSADRTLPEGCTVDQSEPYCIPCTVCTTISTEVGKATGEISANAGDGVDQLKSVRANLNGMLVDIASSVRSTVDSQVVTLNDLITTIDKTQGDVDDVQSQYEKQDSAQKAGVLGLFALGLLVVALGFVGILFGLTPLKFLANIIHLAYFIGFIALILTFLISAIFLAVSVVLGDVCEVTNIFVEDWRVPLGDAAEGLNACFTNESLIEVFNLTSSLEFARGGIKFPEGLDINAMLDFSQLDTFSATILGTTASTFTWDPTKLSDLFTQLNKLTVQNNGGCTPSETYSEANVLTPWTVKSQASGGKTPEEWITQTYGPMDGPCDSATAGNENYACAKTPSSCSFSKAVLELFHGANMLTRVKQDSGTFITDLHTNMTKVTTYVDDFKVKTRALDASINKIKTDLESSLIKYVNNFERAMYCTFIADGYFEIYQALCGDLMPAFTMISFMLFLAGVFLIPVNICLIIAVKRLKAKGNGGHVMDNEMKFK